jgi:hypothetical protein
LVDKGFIVGRLALDGLGNEHESVKHHANGQGKNHGHCDANEKDQPGVNLFGGVALLRVLSY